MMGLLGESLVGDVLLAVATLLGLLYYYLTSTFDYWKKRGVPYVKPTIIFGNLKDQFFMRKHFSFVIQDIYNGLYGERFGGYFELRKPALMVRDPELIERILIKDFSYFSDRDLGGDDKDPLSGNLFNLKGDVWRNLRNKLTPTFTTGKLKGMLEQMCNCGDVVLQEIEKNASSNKAIDAKVLGTLFSIDVTASVSFGLQFKPDSPEGKLFRQMVDEVFAPSAINMIRMSIVFFFKPLAKLLGIRQFSKKVSDYLIDLVKTTMQFREENNIQRNDFLQLMMNLKAQEASGKEMNWKKEMSEEDTYLTQMDYSVKNDQQETGVKIITDECIAAQSLVFLTGGAESVANSVAFALYELACNPEVQTRLQKEIDTVLNKHGGKLTYEGLKEMTYLDSVIQERNRIYSEGVALMRVCDSPYTIPGTKVVIEKGTRVVIPIYAIHNDPAIYPDPEKFIPERFEGNNHRSNSSYLPFGDGPRVCIAMRFVILELKACIAKIMSEYSVTLDSRTKVPLQFVPTTFNFIPIGGIWVQFQKRIKNAS